MALLLLFAALLAIYAAGHALLHKRDPRSALVWVTLSLCLPFLGPLLYWLLGINRITRRALRWQRTGQLLGGSRITASPYYDSARLPESFQHLRDLAILGDRVVRTRLTADNLVEPLFNGDNAYQAMVDAINSARATINLASYIFDGDGAGSRFVDALAQAAGRGVAVRVVVDAMGERYSRITARKALAGSRVDIRLYLPLTRGPFLNLRNHRKLLVVDGIEAFTGGMNIRSNHSESAVGKGEAISDLHFRVKGPVVADLQRSFLEDWYFVSGELLDDPLFFPELLPMGNAHVRAIADGPDRQFRKLEWIVLGAISSARRRIRIMTPYFIPDRPMMTALITAALRGVEITIVLPQANNLPFAAWASRASYWELLKNGIEIHEQPPPFAHTKLFQVDDLWSLIGSANWDTRSFRLNFELNLSVFDQQFADAINRHFDEVLSVSRTVSEEEMDARSLAERLRDCAARLFTPYL